MTSTGRRGYVTADRRWLADERLTDSGLRLMLWLDSHSDEYLTALHVKRTAEEIGWSRDRVTRTLSGLEELGLITTQQVFDHRSGQRTRITLNLSAWTGDCATRRGTAVPHGKAQAVPHGKAPTISTSIDRNEPLELVVPSEATRHSADEPTFDSWYDGYPVKKGKAEARKRWHKMTQAQRIAAWDALSAWRIKAETEGTKYLPMASTFLNQCRWEDEHVAVAPARSANLTTLSNPSLQQALAAIDARQQGELEQ